MNNPNTKTCTKCGETKDKSDFRKNSASEDGLRPDCKKCSYISNKKWAEANKEKAAQSKKTWAAQNKDKVYTSHRKYYEANFDKIKLTAKQWKLDNKEKVSLSSSKYFQENKQAIYEYQSLWRKTNKNKLADYFNNRRAKFLENGSFEISEKFLRKLYNSPCVACGSRDRIEQDHIIPLARGGMHSEGNLQPLCRSCNASKSKKLMIEWKMLKIKQGKLGGNNE